MFEKGFVQCYVSMFIFTGCITSGNCGKTAETSAIQVNLLISFYFLLLIISHLLTILLYYSIYLSQDLLVYQLKGLSEYAVAARAMGVPENVEMNRYFEESSVVL